LTAAGSIVVAAFVRVMKNIGDRFGLVSPSFRGARKSEPGIHGAAGVLGEMDSGQLLRGFRNDDDNF